MKPFIQNIILLIAGIAIGWFIAVGGKKDKDVADSNVKLEHPLSVKLYKFRLNADSMHAYHEWVQWQHTAHAAILSSLEREKMYAEAVFRDTTDDSTSIYWLAINGEGGASYESSPLTVDSMHAAYMRRILQKNFRQTLETAFYLVPAFLEQSIAIHQMEK